MHQREYDGMSERSGGFERIVEQAGDWLRSRTTEHWVMFLIGLIVGLVLG